MQRVKPGRREVSRQLHSLATFTLKENLNVFMKQYWVISRAILDKLMKKMYSKIQPEINF
jgi:hypothetical protein